MSFDSRSVPQKKRPAEASLSAPPAKRSSSVDQKELFRASIKQAYHAFQVLSSDEEHSPQHKLQAFHQLLSALSGACIALLSHQNQQDSSYELDKACRLGDLPSKRLAVKLLPRFVGAFPSQLEAAASSLSALAAADLNSPEARAGQELRLAAVGALGSILTAYCQCLETMQQAERIISLLLW